jgi:hypothetical protein
VHNLELLAVRGEAPAGKGSIPVLSNNNEPKMDLSVGRERGREAFSADLELAVQRIQTIEADFELLHQKYRSVEVARERVGNMEDGESNVNISREFMVEIEQEILAELLNKELWFS